MKPRIAIPVPNSLDAEYAQRTLPQYERAVELAGSDEDNRGLRRRAAAGQPGRY
jgi:hypothetical protein